MIEELKRHLIVLKLNRIWVQGEDFFKIGTFTLRSICMTVLFISTLGILTEMYFASENLTTVTYCISLIGATGPCFSKFYCLVAYGPTLKNILKTLESELPSKYKIDEKEKNYIAKSEKAIKNYLRKYTLSTFLTTTCLSSIPLFKKIAMNLKLIPEGFIGTPVPTWTPFDIYDNFANYALVYVLQTYHWYSVWAIWVGSDVLIGGIAFHLCGHLDIISDRLTDWVSSQSSQCKTRKVETDFKGIISYHTEILKLFKDLNECCNLYHLFQLFFIALVVCSCGTQVLKISKEEAAVGFVMFFLMSCMLSSWLVICVLGTAIITECKKVGQTIYFSDWLLLPSTKRKDILFVITRSQKPVYLYTGKFFKISLPAFLDMVKTSYSFLAVLNEVYD